MAARAIVRYTGLVTEWQRLGRLRVAAIVAGMAVVVMLFAIGYGERARQDAFAQAREQAGRRATLEASALVADIEKFRVLPFVLVELPDVQEAVVERSPVAIGRLNRTLRVLAEQTGATVFYATDRNGIARSASNAGSADSFVGYQFRFRPYFLQAMREGRSEYFAQGSVTGRPGLFLARRVGPRGAPAGVVVVKIEFARIERLWRSAGQSALVTDRDGVILIAADRSLRFGTIAPIAPERRAQIERSRQFGVSALRDAALRIDGGYARDGRGIRYIVVEERLPVLGWRLVHLEPLQPALAAADARTRVATAVVALLLAGLATLGSWSATRRRRERASSDLLEAEVARRTSELTHAYRQLQNESEGRQRADSRYRAAREELAQANRLGSIGTITTSVAHELNQPLAAIRTASENGVKLLARGRIADAEGNFTLIVSLTQRIGTITGELLSYGRRGRGEQTKVPLDEIVEGALMLVGDTFRRRGVALDIARPPALPPIRAARIRIEQVLVNLLQNALDAVTGRPEPRVRLSVEVEATVARLVVADNGSGVPDALRETIFQPFYTGRPDGTGLGLGISREIVKDHRGTLTVSPGPLGGAAFVVELPLDDGRTM